MRERKLNDQEKADLKAWFFTPRKVKDKAATLGISTDTLYAYVYDRHRERESINFQTLHTTAFPVEQT